VIERPRGTNDYIPPESNIRSKVLRIITDFFEKLGYEPVETPIFEHTELFKRSAGISSDIVYKEMYEFKDKKGRDLALRPELTAPVVRAIIQNNLIQKNIIKLYYVGSIFRYEKPQKNRYRQATQFGIEYFGQENYFADLEIINLTYILYSKLFKMDVEIHINSIGCLNCRPVFKEKLYDYFVKFEQDLCEDCKRRLTENPLRILDCKNPICKEISLESPKSIDYLCNDCKTHFNSLLNSLSLHNIPTKIDNHLVRGLDYYNRTVFEVKYKDVDLAGGGRYDYLVNQIDSRYDVPAIGFAGGLERLINTLTSPDYLLTKKTKIVLVSLTDQADQIVFNLYSRIVNKLSKCLDSNFEINVLKFSSLSKALKNADKTGMDYFIFMGQEELNNNLVAIKNMKTGKQEKIEIENFLNESFFVENSVYQFKENLI